MLKFLFHKLIPPFLQERLRMVFDRYARKSYAQEGEDMILWYLFENRTSGFYVDVGAHHPARFSNTYFLYQRGWRGINIDAMPGSMKLFDRYRPLDINLEQAVSEIPGELTYYLFNEPALNGFDARLSRERDAQSTNAYRIVSTRKLKTKRLDAILDEFLPEGQSIDFLSIDVEGLDMEVLRSSNWKRYCPQIVLIEVLNGRFPDLLSSEVSRFMGEQGYTIFSKAMNTVIYRHVNLT